MSKVIFGGLLCVVVITAIPYGTVEPWWKAVFICAVLGIFILRIIENPICLNLKSPVVPLLALSLFAFLQTQISADPFQTQFFALQLLALAAFLALLYRYAATEPRVRVLVFVVIGIATASAIFGILRQTTQHDTGFLLPLLKPNQGFAQFINKNHFAYLMEMAFGLGVGLVIGETSKERLFYLALLVPISLGLVVSNSRGGLVAMLVQVIIAALLLMKRSVLRIAFAAVLIGGVLLAGAASELTLSAAAANEGASRTEIWRATLKLFGAHPLLGIGLGAYWIGITAHHDASGVLVPQEAHNDYLELLASGGLIGFGLGIWFIVSVVRLIKKNLWSNTGFVNAARLGALLGIAGIAVHSLLDFGLHLMSNAVVFLTLIMMVTARIEPEKSLTLTQATIRLAQQKGYSMKIMRRKASVAISTILLFSVLQIGFAKAGFNNTKPVMTVQQIVARLVTRNNQPITVNGQSASSGASLLSGATLETGADQSATVTVGPLGSLDISPNTKVVLTFEQGNLKADVAFGCVILTARQNTTGEITTDKGSVGKTDPATGGVLEMCYQQGAAAPTVGPGVASGAGATTGSTTAATVAGAGGLFGLGWPATVAIIGASTAAAITPLFFPDDNPSPSAP